ncbi:MULTISPECIES: hypothetical protein [Staphylococcus]|uniref:Uncharacterized protein n=1 Tax=Staphylococcus haemolyticus TaxID=1283 RepID=A0A2K0A8B7_STAHA|nr:MULTISPECIES: hypothetical protein [Staphylococcus]KGF26688.1 hypothetical protein HMPREF2135_07005 [Staphylococcus haemolyticus DNF00585]MCH4443216.1 hypothetical protein [Staphylococcus haemolyticus]OFK33790.1 hypothetical protein HMPREF2821_05790 [Staphylococcus sp. HMSC065C10]OFL89350.1 hypothetical protein HMPREF2737_01920 [Staphylococcus sp. HMSC069D12]PNN21264.1 hypothetical protein AL503_010990 [Staphylococcus haemolyticus]
MEHQQHVEELVKILKNECRTSFKFHGEVAMQLFLSDNFILPSRVDICVERKQLVEVLKVIPSTYHLNYYDKNNNLMNRDQLSVPEIAHIDITFNEKLLINIFIYDVVNEEWIFRLDSNIRIPKNSIYFHSLTWGVDYIKPEIVLMYDLLDNQNYHQLPNYKKVLDSLSYYQFVILKVVVGEQRINEALAHNKL